MPTYVIGARLTGNSIKGDQSFAQQVEAIGQVRHQYGGRLISAYVTFGRYDLLFIVEYPDQKSALAAVRIGQPQALGHLADEDVELLTEHQILGFEPGTRFKPQAQRIRHLFQPLNHWGAKYPILHNLSLGSNFR